MAQQVVRSVAPGLGGGGAAPGAGVKAALAAALAGVVRRRALTQTEAARLCGTDQPTLSRVLRGRLHVVSVDKLLAWLAALGAAVEIRVDPEGGGGIGVRDAGAADGAAGGDAAVLRDGPGEEAGARFRALAASTAEGVLVHDGERVVEASDALAAMFGYAAGAELAGRRVGDLVAPGWREHGRAMAAGDHAGPYECPGLRRDGAVFPVEWRGRTVAHRGRRLRVVAARDLTAGREAEAALRESEGRLDLAARAAGIGVFDLHVPSGRVVWSGQEERLFGLEPGTFEGTVEGWASRVLPEDLGPVRAAMEGAMARREPGLDFAFRIRRPDGEVRHLEGAARLLYAGDGAPLRMVGVNVDATGRRRAEAALRESEERYRALVEMSPDAVHVHRDGVIILANRQAAALFGAAGPEDLVGRRALSLIDPASLGLAGGRTARLRAPGDRNDPARMVVRRLDGGRAVVEASSAAVLLDGRLAVQAVLRDVTAREAAEAALRASEEQRRLALEAAGLGVWDLDYATGRLDCDARFRELHGLDPEGGVAGGAPWGRVHPDDLPRVRAAVARAEDSASGGAYEVEYRAVPPDGGERWHLSRAQVHFAGEGAARRPARFVGVVMDVTGRRRTEAALAESEARYRATQEHAGVGIGEVDAEGRFLRVNAAVCAITGYPREELLGRTVFDVTHPEDAASEREDYARLVAGATATYAREKRYLRRDGAERWVEVAATAVRDPGGRFLRGVRVVQDVTERRLAEGRQRLLLAELSHRVKNTLAVVRGIAARTLADDRPPAEARRVLADRLGALARAHEALAASDWAGARLRGLVEAELRPFGARAALDGPDLALAPKAAQTLALVLHELATNAAKHGALSAPAGRVEVAWGLREAAGPGPGGRELRLRWRERGGPAVAAPVRRGFGRTLVEQGWRHELGGEVALDFRPDGLVCELVAPAAAALAA